MKVTALLLGSLLLLTAPYAVAQAKKAAPSKTESAAPCRTSAFSPEQIEAMREDLKKMRSLLAQMQTNLAFVQNAPTPLKHQYELEIDMWRALLDHMERQVGAVTSESSRSEHP